MQQVIDYTIIKNDNYEHLIENVKDYISRGWQPLGHMVPHKVGSQYDNTCYQTLVKYKNENTT